MFDIESFDETQLKEIHKRLSQFSKTELIGIARAFSKWEWPAVLGEPPIKSWGAAPQYRRSWMGGDVCCRSDYIDPYMAVLRVLGVTDGDIYGLTTN